MTVSVTYSKQSIAIVEMKDKVSKNTFSDRFSQQLIAAFNTIKQNTLTKVVILHGYDNYFCCGGSKDELISIYEGRKKFTDLNFYKILIECEVPVICAMQGHALGAGFALGCYGDMMVMAKESLYSTNFMKYGFTPGFGATYIVPKKMGTLVGQEMLLSANYYHGNELQARGVGCSVVNKREVISTALSLAQDLNEHSLIALRLLKAQYRDTVLKELPAVIERELAMHEISFAQADVKQRIDRLFYAHSD